MKKFLFSGVALALALSPALAQQPPEPPKPGAEAPGAPPPPPPGPHGGPKMMGHRPPPPPKGAHYRVEDKGFEVDVKCADDQPANECADILFKILDRVGPPRK